MFRRRSEPAEPTPPWRTRFDAARDLITAQRPPDWLLANLADVERSIGQAFADRERLAASLSRLDADRAANELKDALRRPSAGPDHERLVESLRARYESIHQLANRAEQIESAIDRALADVEVLAARAVALGADEDAWRLDATVRRVGDDVLALEQAHGEVTAWRPNSEFGK